MLNGVGGVFAMFDVGVNGHSRGEKKRMKKIYWDGGTDYDRIQLSRLPRGRRRVSILMILRARPPLTLLPPQTLCPSSFPTGAVSWGWSSYTKGIEKKSYPPSVRLYEDSTLTFPSSRGPRNGLEPLVFPVDCWCVRSWISSSLPWLLPY